MGRSSKGSSSGEIHNPRRKYCEHGSKQVCRTRTDTLRSNGKNMVLKSRDITLPAKIHTVKAMAFPASCTDVRAGP